MDYEKMYKEALSRARESLKDGGISQNSIGYIQSIFPELIKEPEDEKIRKDIISFLKEGKPYHCPNSARRQKWAAWLEKQGEKSADEMIDALRTEYEKGRADAITEMQGEQKTFDYENANIQQKDFAPKSAWSEEDELHLKDAIHAAYSPDCGGDELIDWLKSLKERMKGE